MANTGRPARIDGADGISGGAHAALEPGAEHRIDDHLALAQQECSERTHAATAGREIRMCLARIPPQPLDAATSGRDDADLKAGRLGKTREHVAVTAVVAPAADDDDPVRHGPAGPQVAQRGLAGALHQCVAGYRH